MLLSSFMEVNGSLDAQTIVIVDVQKVKGSSR